MIIGAVEIFSDNGAARSTLKRLERKASEPEVLAYSDALTGVANRRYIDFKGFNGTYGHASGDAVLKAVCETLLHCLRPNDLLGCWT